MVVLVGVQISSLNAMLILSWQKFSHTFLSLICLFVFMRQNSFVFLVHFEMLIGLLQVRFHPLCPEILASGSLDHEVRLWDANTSECIGSCDFCNFKP